MDMTQTNLTQDEMILELINLLRKNGMRDKANDVFETATYVDSLACEGGELMQLEVKHVKKDFTSKRGRHYKCLEDMNLVVQSGELHLLYGASGNGKTTLLNIMTGMLKPSEGQVLLDGKEIQRMKESQLALLRRKCFGYAMQNASLLSSLTVYENITLPLSFFTESESLNIEEQMKKAGLWKVKDSYPSELSGGEYRRCTILRALINQPDFLFADEPTANLDDENAKIIIEMLRTLKEQGTAVVVATHDRRFTDSSEDKSYIHFINQSN